MYKRTIIENVKEGQRVKLPAKKNNEYIILLAFMFTLYLVVLVDYGQLSFVYNTE